MTPELQAALNAIAERVWTLAEVAEFLGVSEGWLRARSDNSRVARLFFPTQDVLLLADVLATIQKAELGGETWDWQLGCWVRIQ